MSNKVEIRPLPRKKWHGYTGKDSFQKDAYTEVLINTSTQTYDTGIDEEELVELQKLLPGIDLTNTYIPDKPHPFWSSKAGRLKLPNKTLILDESIPMDRVKVRNYTASKFVANSMREYEEGKWPDATHVMYNEKEFVEIESEKVSKKRKAYKLADRLTKEQKVSIIQIMLGISVRGSSNDFIEVKLEEALNSDLDRFLIYAKLDKDMLYNKGLVTEGLYKNVLTKEGSGIYYLGDLLGHGIDSVTEYFSNPNNQEVKIKIIEKINS